MTPHQAEIIARVCVRDHDRAIQEVNRHGFKRQHLIANCTLTDALRERFGVSLMRCGAWIAGYRPVEVARRYRGHERVARCSA